jgi:hypothetical protein
VFNYYRWKELQAPIDTQDEVLIVNEISQQARIPDVIEVVDLNEPSTSGQSTVYSAQLSSSKRKLSSDSTESNVPKKQASATNLIDREAQNHKSDCDMQPSRCRCPFVSWIWAQLPDAVKSVRSGKWMLFISKQYVDQTWEKVKNLLASNQLGNGAKVANGEAKTYLICLYTYDFEDVRDVFRVLVALKRNRLAGGHLNYKTDDATYQGLYTTDQAANAAGFQSAKKNHPNEKVSMYTSPPPLTNNPGGDKDFVQLFLNNIGPDCRKGLVAELRKNSDDAESKEIFYHPPQLVPTSLTKRSSKKSTSK